MNRIMSLLWLRWQFLLSNKLFLFVVVTPPLYIILLAKMGDISTGLAYVGTGINTVYAITAGSFTSMMISEEKEKKNLKTLILSGVTEAEYIVSVIVFPILLSFLACLLLPLVIGIPSLDWLVYLVVIGLTIVIFVLLNLLIAFLSKNQIQTNVVSLCLYLGVTFLSILANEVAWIKTLVTYSFIGATTAYFNRLTTYHLTDKTLLALLLWIVGISITLFFAYRYNHKIH